MNDFFDLSPETWDRLHRKWTNMGANSRSVSRNGQEEALNAIEQFFIPEKVKERAKATVRGLAGGALDEAQINAIFDHILDNISIQDAQQFTGINPNRSPIVLSPKQHEIVGRQLEQLPSPLRDPAKSALQKAMDEGRVGLAE